MHVKHHARMRDSKHRTDRRATVLISEIDDSRARARACVYSFIRNLYNLSARDSIYNAFSRLTRDLKAFCNVTSHSPSQRHANPERVLSAG